MPQLLIDEIEDALLAILQSRAVGNGRTAAEEAREILSLALKDSVNDPWAEIDALRTELQTTLQEFGDSTDLIREDHDSLDVLRSRSVEQEVLDLLDDAPTETR